MMPVISFQDKKPQTGEACFIAPNAVVIGDVSLGPGSSIWYGTVLRGDINSISVGEKTNIQDNSVVHLDTGYPTVIGSDVTVGHRTIIHGCTIGDRCLIGMGCIIMNGVEIREECIIGAGALIPEGKKIPPRSLVMGVPGKIVRQLTDDEVENIKRSALHYMELGKIHDALT